MTDLYKDLRLRDYGHIRLLYMSPDLGDEHVEARLEVVSLEDNPNYHALSYTWGEPVFDATITCNGHDLQITSNLWNALLRMRKTGAKAFWVDQICIDQSNLTERGQQVAIMRQIYRTANNVHIWLGPHDDDTAAAVQVSRRLAANEPYEVAVGASEATGFARLVKHRKIYERPWFTRGWIIQEAAANPSAIAFIGDYEVSWVDMVSAAVREVDFETSELRTRYSANNGTDSSMRGITSCLTIGFLVGGLKHHVRSSIFELLRTSPLMGEYATGARDPLSLMSCCNEFEVKDPRDRVYSLLGLLEDNYGGIQPDYHLSVRDVYCQFSKHTITANITTGLRIISGYAGIAIQETLDLPSWCMDFGFKRKTPESFDEMWRTESSNFSAASSIHNHIEFVDAPRDSIRLQGVYIDTITALGPGYHVRGFDGSMLSMWLNSSMNSFAANYWDSSVEGKLTADMLDKEPPSAIRKLAGLLVADSPAIPDPYTAMLEIIPLRAIVIAAFNRIMPRPYTALEPVWRNTPFMLDCYKANCWRRLCFTSSSSKHLCGIVHQKTEIGDQIWILPGANVPVILRPKACRGSDCGTYEVERFDLVGDAFVLGLMHGEALQRGWFQPQPIVLC